jgi:hypothetical protein
MTNQILPRPEQLETSIGTRDDVPRFNITYDYVEAADGRPTGRATRIRYIGGREVSQEEMFVDLATLRSPGRTQ